MTVTVTLPSLVGQDDDSIERIAAELPTERVAEALWFITARKHEIAQMEKMLKSRMAAEGILSNGETWTAPDGSEWFWGGDRERVCSDPAALQMQLAELSLSGLAKLALRAAFKDQPMRVYFRELDHIKRFGGQEAGRIIRSFVSYKESAPKLRPRNLVAEAEAAGSYPAGGGDDSLGGGGSSSVLSDPNRYQDE